MGFADKCPARFCVVIHLDEIRVYQDLGGAELRAAIELVSPANKDRAGSRRTFAAKCAGYLQHGIGVVIVDIVTARAANLPRMPAFEVCVWTMCGRSCRKRRSNLARAAAS